MNDAWFFVGVFALIFLIWIATGGPTRPISFAGPTLALPGALGGGTYLSLPSAPFTIGDSDIELPGSSNGESVSGNGNGSNGTVPPPIEGVAFGTPSPYRGEVSLSHYVSGAASSNPDNESVEISVNQNAGVPVDLTGWTLESAASGAASTIPQGTPVPTSGIVNAAADIVLTPGQQAIIVSGVSPIGASFKENECIGYFAQFQQFSPSLPDDCPDPNDELAAQYPDYIRDNACITYVNSLSRCQAVLSPPVSVSGACQSFLIKYLNYNGCVDAHQSDADFAGDTWRVYLGRSNSMWHSENEVVKLLDNTGKTVDEFSY